MLGCFCAADAGEKLYYRDLTDKEVKGEHGGVAALEGSEPPATSHGHAAGVSSMEVNANREGSEGVQERK